MITRPKRYKVKFKMLDTGAPTNESKRRDTHALQISEPPTKALLFGLTYLFHWY